MSDAVDAILALIAEHAAGPAALAAALQGTTDPLALCEHPQWRPSPRAWHTAARQRVAIDALGLRCVTSSELPTGLRRVRPVPPALFVRGNAELLSSPAVGIVGARQASSGPLAWAVRIAQQAVAYGWLVVSGGARGIDAAAHRAALAAGGRTVVYLGVTADRIFPIANRRLFEQVIEKGGAIVSEHPPLSQTFSASHATRNRLIAGHASHLVIAEANDGSGTLLTATYARRLEVPIWVAPAEIGGARGGIDLLLAGGVAQVLADPGLLPRATALSPA